MMRVLDLWCGTKSSTKAFEDAGCEIVSVDLDPKFNPTICSDIMEVTLEQLEALGPFDFGWASPECTVYSVANLHSGHFKDGVPVTDEANDQNKRVLYTLFLLEELAPLWVLENPRGMLRKQPFMNRYPRVTISYCQYGDDRMKPTDLWGMFPLTWQPRPMCSPGDSCHIAAPRGSRSSTQGMPVEESVKVPYQLGQSLYEAILQSKHAWPSLDWWV
jgi:site-specific DNA-cytosine methylase